MTLPRTPSFRLDGRRVPVTDLKGLLDYLRQNPGRLNYGSAGNGTSHHLAGELF